MSDRLTTRKSPRLPTANGWRQGKKNSTCGLSVGARPTLQPTSHHRKTTTMEKAL